MKIYTFIVGLFGTNCYFIADDSGKTAIVDPGADFEKLIKKLNEKELIPEYILLTHGHFDHILAVNELRKATGAKLIIHRDDAELLSDPDKSYALQFGGTVYRTDPPDRLVSDGDVITLGGTDISVIHTPGHTKGSVTYKLDSALLTGDTLFRDGMGRYDLYSSDFKSLCSSLEKLSALDGDYKVYPGHGQSTTLERERESNIYM